MVTFAAGFGLSFLAVPDRQAEKPATARTAAALSTEDLDPRLESTQRRAYAHSRIARDLIAGRLTLLEAAEHFRDLNHGAPPIDWTVWRERFNGSTDDERHCRQVIQAVDLELRDDREQGAAVVGRLKAELRARAADGMLKLR